MTERYLPISQAPELGTEGPSCADCGGATKRVISATATFADAAVKAGQKYPYVCRSFHPKQLKGIRELTKDGKHAVIESQRHERNVMAASGLTRD